MSEKITEDNTAERILEKVTLKSNDILLLKGEWTQEQIQDLATLMNVKKLNNMCVLIPDNKSLESMPIKDFFHLLKKVEEQINENSKTIKK